MAEVAGFPEEGARVVWSGRTRLAQVKERHGGQEGVGEGSFRDATLKHKHLEIETRPQACKGYWVGVISVRYDRTKST